MKTIKIIFLAIVISSVKVEAQIELIGTALNNTISKVELLQWQALDSNSINTTNSNLDTYLLGSSVFDDAYGNYYFRGTDSLTNGLFNLNLQSGSQNLLVSDQVYNSGVQIDMSNGKAFSLAGDSTGFLFALYEMNLNTNTNTLLGVFNEPITMPAISESTCFDSNNGIFYFIGYDSSLTLKLFSVPVYGSSFSYIKILIPAATSSNILQKIHYNNVSNSIFGMMVNYDTLSPNITADIVSLNKINGSTSVLQSFSQFSTYQNGTSNFDQATGTYMFVGIEPSYNYKHVLFNTNTSNLQIGFLPNNVHNIECDNSKFAKTKYNPTSLESVNSENEVIVWPNPATNSINIQSSQLLQNSNIKMIGMDGRIYLQQSFNGNLQLNTDFLPRGVYFLNISDNLTSKSKLITLN